MMLCLCLLSDKHEQGRLFEQFLTFYSIKV